MRKANMKTLTKSDYNRLRHGGEAHLHCLLTPAMAELLLENMPKNRNRMEKHVDRLRLAIVEGRWAYDANPIHIDWSGNTMGGRHRLTACVLANIPVEVLLVFGTNPETITTSVLSKPWSTAHVLQSESEQRTNVLSTALSMVARQKRGDLTGRYTPSAGDALTLLNENPGLRDSVVVANATSRVLPRAVGAFLHFAFGQVDPALRDRFFSGLATGADLTADHPVLILRNRLIENNEDSKRKIKADEKLAICIKAWNHLRDGRKKIGTLRYTTGGPTPEKFPSIR